MSASIDDPLLRARPEATEPRWLHSIGPCCESPLEVRHVVQRCYTTYCARARRRDITLLTEVSGPLPHVQGCAIAVTRTLHRAVEAAIEVATPGSLVLVCALPTQDGVSIEVGEQRLVRTGLWRPVRRPARAKFSVLLPRVD